MLTGIAARYGLQPSEIAMAGDRIYTDVATARNAGSLGVLVLSGETTLETALASDPGPDLTARTLREFGSCSKRHGSPVRSNTLRVLRSTPRSSDFRTERIAANDIGVRSIPAEVPVYNTNCDAGAFNVNTTTQ